MEVTNRSSWFSSIFLKDAKPFISKRDINWSRITKAGVVAIIGLVGALLMMPTMKPQEKNFHEKIESGSVQKSIESDPTQDYLSQLEQAKSNSRAVPNSLDYLYQSNSGGPGSSSKDRNSSMILSRQGFDSKAQLPPGTKISVRIIEKITLTNQTMPVIGVVAKDVLQEDSLAIPKGSKLFGEVSFNEGSERAQVIWKSVQFPDGRERQISAIGVGSDGQVGVDGNVHSEALKNTIGQTLTRFIGAYAEGSIERGPLGANTGGSENGMRNAVSETAKDRADAWAAELKKEKKWIEIESNSESLAVLTQAFVFRDPGAVYGR